MTGVDRAAFGVSRDQADEHVVDWAEEDRALLARLRDGEDAAFGELFSRHADAVRRLARGLTHDRAEAEDLTAEAFFRVLQAIRRGSGPTDNVRGYLLIVVRRVAWEWSLRRKDVLVSDEELTNRPDQHDAVGQSTERNLIVRAFSTLPERWRNVLWKVEVEGERPAVVAINFGLSPNATAALARRARQGLRAAYLQAHLAVDRSSTGCRSVLEKLGAYTAGSIKGSERRRIHSHLGGCPSCQQTHAELRDVCSGLRAHAGALLVPAALGIAAVKGTAHAGGLAAGLKGLFGGLKLKAVLAASSAAVVGAVGFVAVPMVFDGSSSATGELDGDANLMITTQSTTSLPSIALPTGQLSSALVPPPAGTSSSPAVPPAGLQGSTQGSTQPVVLTGTSIPGGTETGMDVFVYGETTVYRATVVDDYGTSVQETTVITRVNGAGQTTTYTETQTMTALSEPPTGDSGEPEATDPAEPTDPTTDSGGAGASGTKPTASGPEGPHRSSVAAPSTDGASASTATTEGDGSN